MSTDRRWKGAVSVDTVQHRSGTLDVVCGQWADIERIAQLGLVAIDDAQPYLRHSSFVPHTFPFTSPGRLWTRANGTTHPAFTSTIFEEDT